MTLGVEITQKTAKLQLEEKKKTGTVREEAEDRGILLMADPKDKRAELFRGLGRGLQLGQIRGCTRPCGDKNLNNDTWPGEAFDLWGA